MNASLRLVLLAAVFGTGCAWTLKADAPVGWPELKRIEHFDIAAADLERVCGMKGLLACAVVDLCARTCSTYYGEGYGLDWVREHEEGHCRGHDHVGESTFAKLFEGGCPEGESNG